MSETDAATKPAEAAQPMADDKTQPAADAPVKLEPAEAESAEAKPADADTALESDQVKPEATEEKATEKKHDVAQAESKVAEVEPDAQDDKPKILETKAKIDTNNIWNNRKFDPSVREVTDDPHAIRKQVEFYFGDWNFPQDKFMWETCEGTANKPMSISKIHSFKRMRSFQPYSAIVTALRDSKTLDVEGEEGQETVRRKVTYKPMAEGRAKLEASTVYVKGFGDENPDTQFDLESFFAKFGEIKGLKLRRTNEGLFKGSVFVTFPGEEVAKKFIALDPPPAYKEHELKIMSKRDYCQEKSELIRQGKLEPNSTSQKKFFEGKDASRKGNRGNHRGGRGGDDWKARREHDQKHGFQDRRGGRGRGRGRGFGRGGRDGGGRDRDNNRDNGGNRESTNDAKPRIQSTADEAPAAANGKRAREEDGSGNGALAAKKVDVKEKVKTEAT